MSDNATTSLFTSLATGNRRHVSERVFEKLRDGILSGQIPAGFVFPNENDFCQQLNIGRGSLREAYASLETLNLITRSKTGTYVNDEQTIRNSMNFEQIAKQTDAQNLRELREIVEIGAITLAAQKATQEDVQQLQAIVDKMNSWDQMDSLALSQMDFDFHSALIKTTGNELLLILLQSIRTIYEDYASAVFEKAAETFISDHNDIVDAIRYNDTALASRMMRKHLDHINMVYDAVVPD